MAIDRSQMIPPLRGRVIATTAAVSAILCAALPAAALVMNILGGVLYAGCIILAWGSIIAAVVGIIYGLSRASRDNSSGCAVIVGAVIVMVVFTNVHKPLLQMAESLLQSCQKTAVWLFYDLFWAKGFVWMSWIPFSAHLLLILLVLLLIAVCSLEHPVRYVLHKVRRQCPTCRYSGVPHFRCPHPGCNHILTDLRPSRFGIFTARCGRNRHSVSTMDIFGRSAYQTVCPNCARNEVASQKASEFYFGMVGAASAGKSVSLVSGIDRLQTGFAPANRLHATMEAADQAFLDDSLKQLKESRRMAKTGTGLHATALRVRLRERASPAGSTLASLYFYDVDGGLFQHSAGLDRLHFDRRLDGIILVVDPFAETAFHEATQFSQEDAAQANPANIPFLQILESFVAQLEARMNIQGAGHRRFDIPVSVILTKMDASGISQALRPPLPDDDAAPAHSLLAPVDADSRRVRTIMTAQGLGHVVKRVERTFAQVRYFATAAFDPISGHYRPQGMLQPFLWLMNESHVFQTGLKFSAFHAWRVLFSILRGREGERARLILVGSMIGLLCLLVSLLWLMSAPRSNQPPIYVPESAHIRAPQAAVLAPAAMPAPAQVAITPPPVLAVASAPLPQVALERTETPTPRKAIPVVPEPTARKALPVEPDLPKIVPKAIPLTPEEDAMTEPRTAPKFPYRVKIVKWESDGLLWVLANPGKLPVSFKVEAANPALRCIGPETVVNGEAWCPVRLSYEGSWVREEGWVRSDYVRKFP